MAKNNKKKLITELESPSNKVMERSLDDGGVLKKLIGLFRTNTVIRHHFQAGGVSKPQGTAKVYFKNAYTMNSPMGAGYANYDRYARFSDYAEMEAYPTLCNALNIFADEVTQKDEDGKIIKVVSENNTIQKLIQELFDDVLHLSSNGIWKLTRNMLKYGDAFYMLDITENNGVVNMIQMPANEIEREEGFDKDEPNAIRFRWTARQNIEIPNAYVAHFRLDGNDLFKPYGASILEAARRPWKQLVLLEDSVLVYRIQRAPERRIFYLDVQSIPPEDIQNVVNEFNKTIKKESIIDPMTGKIDLRYGSAMPVHKDTLVPLLDGRTVTIEELALEYESGKQNWVYSIQKGTNKTVPGKVSWCGKNYTAKKLIKVWLDDETWVSMAPEHPVLIWNEDASDYTNVRADQLKPGDSAVSLYNKKSTQKDKMRILGYDMIWDHSLNKYLLTHRVVANETLNKEKDQAYKITDWNNNKNLTVHHKDFSKINNNPENLLWIGNVDHFYLHAVNGRETLTKYNKSDKKKKRVSELNIARNSVAAMAGYNGSELHKEHNEIRKNAQLASWANDKEKRKETMTRIEFSQEMLNIAFQVYKENPGLLRDEFGKILNNDPRYLAEVAKGQIGKPKAKGMHFRSLLRKAGFEYNEFKKIASNDGVLNHKILRIEEVDENVDVYCMTVVGPNNEEDRHNFSVKSRNVHGLVSNSMISLANSSDEDYVIPVRGDKTGTRIDTLPGGQNLGDIEDIMFIRANLFAALGIPKAFLTFDEDIKSKQILTQEDIRFARTVARVQEVLISELIKIAMIHLYVKGYRGRDLVNFKISMTNPSTVAELQKLELWRARMDLVASSKEGVFDTNFIYKHFLKMSDETIDKIKKGQIQDKIFQQKLLQIENSQGFNAGGLPGMGMGAPGMPSMGAPPMGGGMPMDQGGAPPNVMGDPAVGALNNGGGIAGEAKDLYRSSDGNSRKKAKRGLEGTDLIGAGDADDDPSDLAGIRRTITSPMGGRESRDYRPTVAQHEKGLLEEVAKTIAILKEMTKEEAKTSNFPEGMNENVLHNTFDEQFGIEHTTKTILKESYMNNKKKIYEEFNAEDKWAEDIERFEESFNKLMEEINSNDK